MFDHLTLIDMCIILIILLLCLYWPIIKWPFKFLITPVGKSGCLIGIHVREEVMSLRENDNHIGWLRCIFCGHAIPKFPDNCDICKRLGLKSIKQ